MHHSFLLASFYAISVTARAILQPALVSRDLIIPQVDHLVSKRDINLNFIDWDDPETLANLRDGSGNQVVNPQGQATEEFNAALELANAALTAINDPAGVTSTAEWQRWFGNGDHVNNIRTAYQNLVGLFSPSNNRRISVFLGGNAQNVDTSGRTSDVFAINTGDSVTVFNQFWRQSRFASVVPPSPTTATNDISGLDSRAATLLHELLHFQFILPGSTGTRGAHAEVYSPVDVQNLARTDPATAAINPETYTLYALDVFYGWSRNRAQHQPSRPLPPIPGARVRRPLPALPSPSVGSPDPVRSSSPQRGLFWFPIVHFGKYGTEF
ncbi:hypothetical protein F5B20DRAFT_594874 [Whalleya microplaca]|nr:hypothetical protein F5B20DRAFT_594874 [Whalleya microplaca]